MANKKVRATGRISKQREIEQKKRKRRRIAIIIISCLIIIIGICAYLLNSPTFKITTIDISGNVQLTQEQVQEMSEIKTGDSIFSTFNIVVKVKLKQHGYIEEAKVSKEYPNTIKIEIKERQKEYQIQTPSGQYVYIDGQGYLLESSTERLELKTIIGMSADENSLQTQHRLDENDLVKMENVLQIIENTKEIGIADKITQFDVQDEYIVELANDGIKINFGNATNLKERMYYVKAILDQEVGHRGTIYVNGNLNEGFTPYFSEG